MKVIHLEKNTFSKIIEEGIVLIKFGTNVCSPCVMMVPVLKNLAEKFGEQVMICEVNAAEEKELVMDYSIRDVPTTFIFKDGKIVYRETEFKSEEFLTKKLNEIMGNPVTIPLS